MPWITSWPVTRRRRPGSWPSAPLIRSISARRTGRPRPCAGAEGAGDHTPVVVTTTWRPDQPPDRRPRCRCRRSRGQPDDLTEVVERYRGCATGGRSRRVRERHSTARGRPGARRGAPGWGRDLPDLTQTGVSRRARRRTGTHPQPRGAAFCLRRRHRGQCDRGLCLAPAREDRPQQDRDPPGARLQRPVNRAWTRAGCLVSAMLAIVVLDWSLTMKLGFWPRAHGMHAPLDRGLQDPSAIRVRSGEGRRHARAPARESRHLAQHRIMAHPPRGTERPRRGDRANPAFRREEFWESAGAVLVVIIPLLFIVALDRAGRARTGPSTGRDDRRA